MNSTSEVLDTEQLARIMGTTVQAIRSALYRGLEGKTIPPSITLGTRRRWLRSTVFRWLRSRTRSSTPVPAKARQLNPPKEDQQMARLKIRLGEVFADGNGNQMTVLEVDSKADRVVFEDEDGDECVMSLEDCVDEIRTGQLELVEDAEEESP